MTKSIHSIVATLLMTPFIISCAATSTTTRPAPTIAGKTALENETVSIPVLSTPDTGARLDTRTGRAMSKSIVKIVRPLKQGERVMMMQAITFLSNYEACKTRGYPSYLNYDQFLNKGTGSRQPYTPEKCYEERSEIHKESSQLRHIIMAEGRPDGNKRVVYNTLATGQVDRGWSDAESWDRFVEYTGSGLTGMSRTDILTSYNTIMGDRAEIIGSEALFDTREFLSNPLGKILGRN